MKVERNRDGNKYTFIPEDKKDEKFLDKINKKIDELEEESQKLRKKNEELKDIYTKMRLIRTLSHISWMFGICLYVYYTGTDVPNLFILLVLSAATLISFVYSVILTDNMDKK